MIRLRAVALAFTLLGATPLTASLAAQGAPAAELPGRIVSVNPFLPLFGFFQGEFESRVNKALTFAVASSYTEWNSDRTLNLDAKVRWYGQERAPNGLGMAASLGVGRVDRDASISCDYAPVMPICTTRERGALTVPAFAVEGQYQWLLGSRRNTAVSVGFGVKRYFASETEMDGNVRPMGRLTIGYAFK
jgi:hypothetical protein